MTGITSSSTPPTPEGENWAGTWYLDTLSCALDSGDWRTTENLFPLHLMPQDAFFERDGAALKLEAGSRVELSPVTLEDGEGVFTARLTYQTDSTQPTLRFSFRTDDSGRSVTVDFD